jgi:hypothetical protein
MMEKYPNVYTPTGALQLVMGNWFPSGNRLYQLFTQPETGLNRFLTYSANFSRK